MMQSDAEEVFNRAGVPIQGNEELFEFCAKFLGDLNAKQSVLMGNSAERLREYKEQKDVFVADLEEMKKSGKVVLSKPVSAPPPTLP